VAETARLATTREPRCGPVRLVAVDGPSGSGKSVLGAAVGQVLACPVIHMDDIYPGWDGLADAVPLVTTQVLEPLARGEAAAYRRWDWVHNRWSGRTVRPPPAPTLVLEGVGSSVLPAGDYAAVCVWVEASRSVRFARGIHRDGEASRPHRQRWAAQEEALFAADRTRDRADVVLDTTNL
jgi:adenylate kinase family enzyme